jgi:CheY-like chemotaxis protein
MSLHVLLADDEPLFRELGRMLADSLGVRMTVAEDGFDAVEKALAAPFDLILMDVSMPRLDGPAAVRRIRQGESDGERRLIVGLTAHNVAAVRASLIAAGMDDVAEKPLSREDFASLLGMSVEPPAPPPSAQLVDFGPLAELCGDEEMEELLDAFLHGVAANREKLTAAIAAADIETAARAAHAMKGLLSQVGASQAAGLAKKLEIAIREGGAVAAARAVLEAMLDRVVEAVIARKAAG